MKKQTQHEFQSGFGKLVKGVSSLLLQEDQLSDALNFQPGYQWRQRRGMSVLTASAVATGLRFRSMMQFRDLPGNTDLILAHTYDSVGGEDIYKGSALPPNAITWTKIYDLTAGAETGQWANVWNAALFADDKEFLIWRGNEFKPNGVFFFDGATSKYINYWQEVIDEDDDTVMPLNSMDWDDEVDIISEMPIDTINWEFVNLNSVEGMCEVYYWNGAWTKIEKNTLTNDGNMLIDPCENYATNSWSDLDTGPGASTQETWNGREVFQLDQTAGGATRRLADIGSFTGKKVRFTHRVYFHGFQDGSLNQYPNDDGTHQTLIYIRRNSLVRYFDTGSQGYTISTTFGEPLYTGWYDINYELDFTGGIPISTFYIDDTVFWTDEDNDQQLAASDGNMYLTMADGGLDTEILRYSSIRVSDNPFTATGDGFVDGTRLAGVTMGQDGAMTWDAPGDEIATVVNGISGFAYKVRPLSGLDSTVSVKQMSVAGPMLPVQDIWDGTPRLVQGCYVYDGSDYTDYSIYVNNIVESQAADLSAATTSYQLLVGFAERQSEITFYPASQSKNDANSQIDAVKYHDNTGAAVSVGAFTDTTLDVAADSSFAQKGTVKWSPPDKEDEKATTVGGDTTPWFWYIFEWDATLADPTEIYFITGVPVSEPLDHCYGTFAYKRRAWQLAPLNRENEVRYSSTVSPNIWNGADSGYIGFGERPLRAAAPFYNETVIFADNEIWMLQGNRPVNFGRLRISDRVGISAPHSLISIESGVEINETMKITLAWFYNDGIWMFDGVRIWKISSPDIDSFFEPDHPDYINPAKLAQTYGEFAFNTQLAMWNVYSGDGAATTPTKTIVLHFPTLTYGIYQYGTTIDAMLSVINERFYMVGGGHDNGKFYLLDDGVVDLNTGGDEVAVDAYLTTRDQFQSFSEGQTQRLVSVYAESEEGGLMELDEYPDGSETPQKAGEQSLEWLGKIFGAFQKNVKIWPSQKTSKFRFRNRSKNARMKLIGHSTTVDRSRSNE